MSYKLKSADSNTIVFERLGAGCNSAIMIVVGGIFFGIGVILNLFSPNYAFPDILFLTLFPFIGFVILVVGITLPSMERKSKPQLITFDNTKGAVIIQMAKDGNQVGYIRYDEIEGFDIHVQKTSSSSSSSSAQRYYFHAFLKKKDGGEWFLSQSRTRESAEADLRKIYEFGRFDTPFTVTASPSVSAKIQKEEKSDRTTIKWHNKLSFFAPLGLLVSAVAFPSIMVGVINSGPEKPGLIYLIIGIILIVFSLVIFFIGRSMYIRATTSFAISIDPTNLVYAEMNKSTGAVKKSKVVPLAEVFSVTYSFSKRSSGGGLNIRTEKEHLQAEEMKKPLVSLKEVFSIRKDESIALSIAALNPVECLQLETWLQEVIGKRGNTNVR